MKRWKYILTASVIAWGMVMQPIHATAAELTTNNSPNSQMKITATVKDQESPNYSVVIPSTLPLGKVNKVTDSVKAYEITVKTEDINGKVTVSAPEKGSLLNGDYVLSFTNDFGIQTFQSDETMMEKILAGKIYIASEDVENVPAGVYRGTTTFTITYEVINNKPVDTPTLEPTPEPTPEPIPDLNLDKNNLQDGVYSITGNMVKIDKKSKSMADNAIHHTIKLTVKDGKYYLTLDFDGLDIGGMYGYMGQLSYYLDGYTQNQYGAIQGSVLSGTIEKYQLDSSGNKISDKYGTDYPKLVSFPMIVQAVNDGFVPLQVQVPIMDTIAGAGTQQMFLALNWSTLAKTEVDNPAFDHDKSDD